MTTTLHCRALQHDFAVEVADADLGEQLGHVLRDLATAGPTSRTYRLDGTCLTYEGEVLVTGAGVPHALATLLWHINQETVRRSGADHVLLHAAGAVKDGVAVLLPAPMEHGKTTTVAGLLRAGYDYLSDEICAVDPNGLLVHAFPKPLSLDRGSWAVLPELAPAVRLTDDQWQVPASGVGAAVSQPVRAGLVVVPGYRPGARTELLPLSRSEALVLLAESCFGFRARPARDLPVLGRLLSGTSCFRLQIGDLDEAVALVDGAVRERAERAA